jgi:pyruvate dehydrogenase E2 component (dihydrolipoamide acetyltransferase)
MVRSGEPLFELEGDKAIQEIEAVDDGILRIPPDAPAPGSDVLVGTTLGYLVADGEPLPWKTQTTAKESTAADDDIHAIEHQSDVDVGADVEAASLNRTAERRLAISPRAKRIASDLGIDWTQLTGSGANGRIRERDVRVADEVRKAAGGG